MLELRQDADALMRAYSLEHSSCRFLNALPPLRAATSLYRELEAHGEYLECQSKILRLLTELELNGDVEEVMREVQAFALSTDAELTSKICYNFGLAAFCRQDRPAAFGFFKNALRMASDESSEADFCYAKFGIAMVYREERRLAEAIAVLSELDTLVGGLDLGDLRVAGRMCRASIANELKDYDSALAIYWSCYADTRLGQNMYLRIYLLYTLAKTYRLKSDFRLASIYLNLAIRLTDPVNLPHLHRNITELSEEMGIVAAVDFDLVLDLHAGLVTEKIIGPIQLGRQHLMIDILRMFMSAPGRTFSKEELVSLFWKENYDPTMHDNKIFVTIRRLRNLIEPNRRRPCYILRSQNGYCFRPNARALVLH